MSHMLSTAPHKKWAFKTTDRVLKNIDWRKFWMLADIFVVIHIDPQVPETNSSFQIIFPSIPWLWDFIKTGKMTHSRRRQLANGGGATRPHTVTRTNNCTQMLLSFYIKQTVSCLSEHMKVYLYFRAWFDFWGKNIPILTDQPIYTQFIYNVMCHCYFFLSKWTHGIRKEELVINAAFFVVAEHESLIFRAGKQVSILQPSMQTDSSMDVVQI